MEAFVYKWTIPDSGKFYIGYHKGDPDDGYTTSSENPELIQYIESKIAIREILKFGLEQDMMEYENQLLDECDAKNNELCYNKHNGQVKITEEGTTLSDCKLVMKVREKIQRAEKELPNAYPIRSAVKGDVDPDVLPTHQTRKKDLNSDFVQQIVDRMKQHSGNLINTNIAPLIIVTDNTGQLLTDGGSSTDKLLIDGNHTRAALLDSSISSHTLIRVIYIPFEDLKFNMNNLRDLSLGLNSNDQRLKQANSDEDLLKRLEQVHKDGGLTKEYLKYFGEINLLPPKRVKELAMKVRPESSGTFITSASRKVYEDRLVADKGPTVFSDATKAPQCLGYLVYHCDKEGTKQYNACYCFGRSTDVNRDMSSWDDFLRIAGQLGYQVNLYELRYDSNQAADYTFIGSSFKE